MDILKIVQKEMVDWQEHNFPNRPSWQPLIGLMEELGELSHAHLKEAQNIRMTEDHIANAKDAIGDMIIFMCDYCNSRGWDITEIIDTTWKQVRERDWRKP